MSLIDGPMNQSDGDYRDIEVECKWCEEEITVSSYMTPFVTYFECPECGEHSELDEGLFNLD